MEPRNPNFNSRDFYEILDVPRDATQPQITKAYRLLARRYHPDKNQDDPDANAKFMKIGEAYATLRDPKKRAVYNNGGPDGIDDYEEYEAEDEASEERESEKVTDSGDEEQGQVSSPSMTPEEAERIYKEVFGRAYEQYHHDPGNRFGYTYAEDVFNAFRERRLADRLTCTIGRFKVTFLLEWLIKLEINKCVATEEIILNWLIIFSWFAVSGDPENMTPRWVGGIALFFNSWILHNWYGFLKYPSASKCCALSTYEREAMSIDFNDVRDICSMLLHGDSFRRGQYLQILITLPATFLNHAAALAASTACWIIGCQTKYSESSRIEGDYRVTYRTQHHTAQQNRERSGAWGMLAVTIFWPVVFIASPGLLGASIAVIFFFANQHLFNSLLFRKSFLEFIIDAITGNLFAVVDILPPQQPEEAQAGADFDVENPPGPSGDKFPSEEETGSGRGPQPLVSECKDVPLVDEATHEVSETTRNEVEYPKDHRKTNNSEDSDPHFEESLDVVNTDPTKDDDSSESYHEQNDVVGSEFDEVANTADSSGLSTTPSHDTEDPQEEAKEDHSNDSHSHSNPLDDTSETEAKSKHKIEGV